MRFAAHLSALTCGTVGAIVFAGRVFADPIAQLGFIAIVVGILAMIMAAGSHE